MPEEREVSSAGKNDETIEEQRFTYPPTTDEFMYKGILWNIDTTLELLKKVEQFEFRDSDVVLCTFPRSGTTLTQEIVWHIQNKDVITRGASYPDLDDRFPFLEYNAKHDDQNLPWPPDVLDAHPTDGPPRLIKTHCPLRLMEPALSRAKPRIILVMRNPKDVAVSYFHFYRGLSMYGPWTGDWPTFLEMFLRGCTKCGSWFDWHLDWWRELGGHAEGPSAHDWPILTLTYEDLLADPRHHVCRIADFLGTALTPEQLDVISHNCHFDTMSANKNVNFEDKTTGFRFIRRGGVGGWKEHFTVAQNERFDFEIEKRLGGTGLVFQYE